MRGRVGSGRTCVFYLLLVAADELDGVVPGEPPHALGQVLPVSQIHPNMTWYAAKGEAGKGNRKTETDRSRRSRMLGVGVSTTRWKRAGEKTRRR